MFTPFFRQTLTLMSSRVCVNSSRSLGDNYKLPFTGALPGPIRIRGKELHQRLGGQAQFLVGIEPRQLLGDFLG
jgi:hypothetical protein